MLVLMVIPSAIPFLVAGQHYCWPVLKSVLPTTCSTACCQSCDANDTKYSLVDRQDRTSSAMAVELAEVTAEVTALRQELGLSTPSDSLRPTPTPSAHEMPTTSVEQTLQEEGP